MTKRISNIFSAVLLGILLVACSGHEATEGDFALQGTWVLESTQEYEGEVHKYDQINRSWLRIYDDSCYYECYVDMAPTGKIFAPTAMEPYTLIERGPNDYLYLQDDNTHPFNVLNDSTITIQEKGLKYTWKTTRSYDEKTLSNILNIIKEDMENSGELSHRYVLSYAEHQLESANHRLTFALYTIAIIVLSALLVASILYIRYRRKKQVEQELRQLEQEREALPEPIREARNTVEEDFHQSDFYLALRQKITRGERLSQEDWNGIEEHFKQVYPRFTTTLLTLRNMSALELQVCQLLKLGCSPSEIAEVLCKDKSSISTIRSRLYGKVFGKKGSSKDWDDFIIHNL